MEELTNIQEFNIKISNLKLMPPHAMKLEGYRQLMFECGCGDLHEINGFDVQKIAAIYPLKVIMKCATHYTLVRLKGLIRVQAVSEWTINQSIVRDAVKNFDL